VSEKCDGLRVARYGLRVAGCELEVFRFGISDMGFWIEKIDRMTSS
jgi:hypothetical protein